MTGQETPTGGGSGRFADFVLWVVDTYELWSRIPACWESHRQVTNELRALQARHLQANETAESDPAAGVAARADWHDYLGRMLTRLADGPAATCAQARVHHVAQTWDDDDFLARKAAQRAR